ncbi:MAG: hypothetical protein LBG80_00290 [Bacteroidales bacterium]|jgi:hypothetical protein|nr:hypothetical protein [Bacteroidales bacterium]
MSYRTSTLRKPDAEFLALAITINTQCHQNEPVWYIEKDRLDKFDELLRIAQDAYTKNIDKATKNAITASNKQMAFTALRQFLSPFIDYLVVNMHVPEEALAFMGLRSRHRHAHQPLPRPKDEIVISVKKQHNEITVYAARPEHDHPTAGTGTTKDHGFMIRYKEENKDYKFVVSTRLHHTLFFEREDEGKRLWISAAWVNPRLETGPWSDEISEIIG